MPPQVPGQSRRRQATRSLVCRPVTGPCPRGRPRASLTPVSFTVTVGLVGVPLPMSPRSTSETAPFRTGRNEI